jgi:putative mRNA 3-end processing factor
VLSADDPNRRSAPLLQSTDKGLFCDAGAFHIDPWRPVENAVITHAHSDHARWGNKTYITSREGAELLRERVGPVPAIRALEYGEKLTRDGVMISLHPAGHIRGSAQVRVEYRGEVWVVGGDYKAHPDPTCSPIEPVRCHTFVTESTFGLPIYHWPRPDDVVREINEWWRGNQERGRTSVLYAYSLGKAQHLLARIDASIGPILLHGATLRMRDAYGRSGCVLPEVMKADVDHAKAHRGRALVVAPISCHGSPWLKKFQPASTASASGWMTIRGARRRMALDRGFAFSDHADWDGLIQVIRATGAENVLVTHGYTDVLTRWLAENGWNAGVLPTPFMGEIEGDETEQAPPDAASGAKEA